MSLQIFIAFIQLLQYIRLKICTDRDKVALLIKKTINPSSTAEHFTLSAHGFENETMKMVGNIPSLRQTNNLKFTH